MGEVNIKGNIVNPVKLSKSDTTNIKKVTNFMIDLVRKQRRLTRKELNDWERARRAFYNNEKPRTHLLQEVYEDSMLDGHLTGIVEDRVLRTSNSNYIFSIDGKKNDKLTEFIKDKTWFEELLNLVLLSPFYGHSLCWIKEFEKGLIKKVELITRSNVVPSLNALLLDIEADKYLDYSTMPELLLYAQFGSPAGLLEKAVPFTILKRHSWGSWDEFEELFGIPIRIAKIASQSETVKNEVSGWLEEMGSAAYGVFPIGTEIDIKENSKSDAFNVFFQKIKALDTELSKLVLHQTMTTENGSSRSQGEVHERTLDNLIKSDKKKTLAFLNEKLVPAMRAIGYSIPENAKIAIEKTTNTEKQIKIDDTLLRNGVVLTKEYLEKTYGVEIEQMPQSKSATEKKM